MASPHPVLVTRASSLLVGFGTLFAALQLATGTEQAVKEITFPLPSTATPYTRDDWKRDWPGAIFEDGVSENRVSLVARDGVPALRVRYPGGAVRPGESGASWRFPFERAEAVTLSYRVRFDEDFDFVKGGKLPGLCGGPETVSGGDPVDGLTGFSVRLMWRREGRGQAYVYHMGQPGKYGDEFDFPKDFHFPTGTPVDVRIEVTMNQPGRDDGSLRVWIGIVPGREPELLVEETALAWRATTDYGVDSILFSTFHGGSDASWAPGHDVHAEFSQFRWESRP